MNFSLILNLNKTVHVNVAQRALSGLACKNPIVIDNKFCQKSVRVSILGADTSTGEITAFLLKQNPVVSQIYLYGTTEVLGIAADLKHLDTRSEIKAYFGKNGLNQALRRADIVLLIGEDKFPASTDVETRLRSEIERLIEFTKACSKFAPKALIVVGTRPISTTMPIVTAIFKKTPWYHPARIIGSVSLTQARVNSYIAAFQDLDPRCVHVPLLGGPDLDNVVPLFTRASPIRILPYDTAKLYKSIMHLEEASTTRSVTSCKIQMSALSEGYSLNQLVTSMAIGLFGDDCAISSAFVRQNIIKTCRYLVSTVKFGPGGVVHNYGVPDISKMELGYLEKATFDLDRKEKLALKVFDVFDKDTKSRQCGKRKKRAIVN